MTRRRPTKSAADILPDAFRGRLVWNEKAQRYRRPNGKFVGALVVRQEIDREIAASEARLLRHGRRWFAGDLHINDWRALCADEIKLNFLANYAAGRGGFAQLSDADYKEVERMVRRQFKYLERFAREIDAAPDRLSEKAFLNRLGMYAQAGREAHEEARRQGHKTNGYKFGRNVPHSRESCNTVGAKKGCSELTAIGWLPIDKIPMPGRRACYTRCLCTIEYIKDLPADQITTIEKKTSAKDTKTTPPKKEAKPTKAKTPKTAPTPKTTPKATPNATATKAADEIKARLAAEARRVAEEARLAAEAEKSASAKPRRTPAPRWRRSKPNAPRLKPRTTPK